MPSSKVKIQTESNCERTHITQLTEQDLTISYSKYLPQINFQQESTTSFRKSVKSKKDSLPQLTFSSFANLSELFKDYQSESQGSVDNQEVNNNDIYEETVKIQDEQHRQLPKGQNPIENNESSNTAKVNQPTKPSKLSLRTMRMKEELEGFFQSKNQKEIEEYVKRIDKQLKQLNANKNRLKYILRIRQGNAVNQELIQTKLCPCCGKTITKLCFHCQHDKCQKSSCPRMKKQKLNAKMLVKLKEKKGGAGENRRFKRSRDKDPKQQKLKRGFNDEELSFSSDQYESEEGQNSEENLFKQQKMENMRLRNREVRKVPPIPNFDKTMTDIPLHESKLFIDSDSQ